MSRIEMLASVGVIVNFEHDYETGGEKDAIDVIHLGFTPEEWVALTMRDPDEAWGLESMYVGGCCANMTALQDTINSVYRDGYIDGATFLDVALLARAHDGFDEFDDMTDEQFASLIARWASLDPWQKMGVVYQAVRDHLVPCDYLGVGARADYEMPDEKRAAGELLSALNYLDWEHMYARDKSGDQHAANVTLQHARAYQPAKRLVEFLATMEPFEGFAIVKTGTDEILRNAFGETIFSDRGSAAEVVDLWERMERDAAGEHVDVEIVPVRITAEDGVKLR